MSVPAQPFVGGGADCYPHSVGFDGVNNLRSLNSIFIPECPCFPARGLIECSSASLSLPQIGLA